METTGSPCHKTINQNDNKKEDQKLSSITGLVYDERMAGYECITPHPECPGRITSIYKELLDLGLVDRCYTIKPRLAKKEEILMKHSEKQFDFVTLLIRQKQEDLDQLQGQFDSIYLHQHVSECALLSAGCTLELVEQILKGNIRNGAAVVRPPGHHALESTSMGYCHFNNVALAAMLAIRNYNLSRILIVDWDVHYGNATHQMFDEDPRVLYFSLHRYDNLHFWPHVSEGNFDAVGKAKGEGFNMHVAWNRGKINDSAYLYAFDNLLIPVIKDYDPEIVLVSAGFDSGEGDPIGLCKVTPAGYAQMTKRLMEFANGKVVVVLEGGYNLKTNAKSMASCISTLLGDGVPTLTASQVDGPSNSALQSITDTYFTHLPYWKNALGPLESKFGSLRLFLQNTKDSNDKDNGDLFDDENSSSFVKDLASLKLVDTTKYES